MNNQLGEEMTLEASSISPAMTQHTTQLFPLPLTFCPSTHRSSGHRRRRLRKAAAVHAITNSMIRALNTLNLNYPAAVRSLSFSPADPSLAQSRLTDSLLNAAAVYYNASRQCFDAATHGVAGVTPCDIVGGGVTLIPGCSLKVPRPRDQAVSTSIPTLVDTPPSPRGLSLFIFDESTLVHSSMDGGITAVPDTYAVDCENITRQSINDAINSGFQLLDLLPSLSDSASHFGYIDPLPQGLVPLIATRVALPSELNNVPLLSLLPESISSLYNNFTSLLLPPALVQHNLTEAHLRKPRVLATRTEYVALISRMARLGMLSMTTTPVCINGLFGVPKGDKIRLILDARPANCYFVRPPRVKLPSPSHLAALRIPRGHPLYVSKMDLSNFYHQLTLPDWIRPFFALPALTVDEISSMGTVGLSEDLVHAFGSGLPVYPCCATLPMGFSHSVFLAQSVHESVLYRDMALRACDNVLSLVFSSHRSSPACPIHRRQHPPRDQPGGGDPPGKSSACRISKGPTTSKPLEMYQGYTESCDCFRCGHRRTTWDNFPECQEAVGYHRCNRAFVGQEVGDRPAIICCGRGVDMAYAPSSPHTCCVQACVYVRSTLSG